jgi:hypothetical protein
MTGAERQQRYVARLVAAGQPTAAELAAAGLTADELTAAELVAVKIAASKLAAANALRDDMEKASIEALGARDARIDALRARVTELEAELTRERAKAKTAAPGDFKWPRSDAEWAAAKQAATEARKAGRAKAKAARAAAAPVEQDETIETVREERDKWKAECVKRNTRIANLLRQIRATADKRAVLMSKALHKHIVAALHPDRAPRHDDKATDARIQNLWTKRAQDFAALKVAFTDE